MDIDAPMRRDLQPRTLSAIEQPGIDTRVLMNQHRSLCAIRGCDQAQLPAPLLLTEVPLFVARLDAALTGRDPDLQKMYRRTAGGIELAVLHATPGAHALHV